MAQAKKSPHEAGIKVSENFRHRGFISKRILL